MNTLGSSMLALMLTPLLMSMALCAAGSGSPAPLPGPAADPLPNYFRSGVLDFESRVWAQTQIERVFYGHRIWPKENPGSKPPFEAGVPVALIEGKVRDMLRQSTVLQERWNTPITPAMLQGELDRLMSHTRDPVTLRELIEALRGDSFLVAETLARGNVVTRLIHDRYSQDLEIHAKARISAARALSQADISDWSRLGGVHLRHAAMLEKRSEPESEAENLDEQPLDEATFQRMHDNSPDPSARVIFTEATEGFILRRTLMKTPTRVVTERLIFTKVQFGDWWREHSKQWTVSGLGDPSRRDAPHPAYRLKEIKRLNATGCNEWRTPLNFGPKVPSARINHTAVWTGAEMIVWGGGASGYNNTGGRYNPALDQWAVTSTGPNVPEPREHHTAVWTGSLMIVWGGGVGGGFIFNSGGRYDPATDSWMLTSTGSNSPDARNWHTAVWTGSEMLVWGGAGSSTQLGGRYNPLSDSWQQISTGGPTARYQHTAVWTGSEMIIWGGAGGGVSGGRYDPANDSWTPTSVGENVPSPRNQHTAVWTGSEMIVWGGVGGGGTGARYNPATDSWLSTGAGFTPFLYGTAIWTGTDMIIWGGIYMGESTKSSASYNPSTDTWAFYGTTLPDTPGARHKHTAVWTGSEMIVWGGETSACPPFSACYTFYNSSGGKFNPLSSSWVATSTFDLVPWQRTNHAAVWTGSEMIIWGGYSGYYENSGGRYSPALDLWARTPSIAAPAARTRPTGIWTGSDMIVWGGYSYTCGGRYCFHNYHNTGGRYNPSSDQWIPTSTAVGVPPGRTRHTAIWTGRKMIIWGGWVYYVSSVNSGGKYDPFTDNWTPTSIGINVPASRIGHSAVWSGDEMIIWGGNQSQTDPATFHSSGGRYNPDADAWTPTSINTDTPSPRASHTAVWTGDEMIVWGGSIYPTQNNYYSSGSRYNPRFDTWRKTSEGLNLPDARSLHTAIWTGSEMIIWGGYGAAELSTGGRFNPAADSWLSTSTAVGVPAPRASHSAIWTGNEMIIWGGNNPEYLNSGGIYSSGSAPSPGNLLRAARTSSINLVWGWVYGSGSYNVKRCDTTVSGCIPGTIVSTPTIPQYSEPDDGQSHFYAVEAVNQCGATP